MEISDYYFEIGMISIYLLVLPFIIFAFSMLHKYLLITRRAQKMRREADRKNLPKPLWPKVTRALGFSIKSDTRPFLKLPLTNKQAFYLMYLTGLVLTGIGAFIGSAGMILSGMGVFFVAVFFSLGTSGRLLKQRDKIIERIFRTVNSKMFYEREVSENPSRVITVKSWRNFVEPDMLQIEIPPTFSQEMVDGFMRQFNQNLSKTSTESEERAWVPDDDLENGKPGWDFPAGVLTLRTVPPLPTMAPWHEKYVEDERIAWSFFPLGIAVEDGVLLKDKETGEEQNIVGIDVSGKQISLGKKLGVPVSSKIMPSPQALIAGGTGGGKSLAINTMVPVLKNPEE